METKPFNYATIRGQEEFIKDKLHVNIFPTHFLIDKDGVIKKVVTKFDELSMTLNGSGILDIENGAVTKMPPPPPPMSTEKIPTI